MQCFFKQEKNDLRKLIKNPVSRRTAATACNNARLEMRTLCYSLFVIR